jgi:PTH1 family peptidyl-tRNA hydrolase
MIQLVTFLGNPGSRYEKTRHNVGFRCARHLSFSANLQWQNKFQGLLASSMVGAQKVWFLKPNTYMNKSGQSVQAALSFFKLPLQALLVVHDDVELEFARFDLKEGGGLAGHNGLRSISSQLGSRQFKRLRIGVGRPVKGDVSSYVLSPFSKEEERVLPDVLEETAAYIEALVRTGT